MVLTLRHGVIQLLGEKKWKQNSHYFAPGKFTLLNKGSADTHRLLSFPFTGCSSSFSTPTKAAVPKHLQMLLPPIIASWMSAVPCFPVHPGTLEIITNSTTSPGQNKSHLGSKERGSWSAKGQPRNQEPL